jgi:hypothetical protein
MKAAIIGLCFKCRTKDLIGYFCLALLAEATTPREVQGFVLGPSSRGADPMSNNRSRRSPFPLKSPAAFKEFLRCAAPSRAEPSDVHPRDNQAPSHGSFIDAVDYCQPGRFGH